MGENGQHHVDEQDVDFGIKLLQNGHELVNLLAMVAAGRDVPVHIRDEAIRLLEKVFVHDDRRENG